MAARTGALLLHRGLGVAGCGARPGTRVRGPGAWPGWGYGRGWGRAARRHGSTYGRAPAPRGLGVTSRVALRSGAILWVGVMLSSHAQESAPLRSGRLAFWPARERLAPAERSACTRGMRGAATWGRPRLATAPSSSSGPTTRSCPTHGSRGAGSRRRRALALRSTGPSPRAVTLARRAGDDRDRQSTVGGRVAVAGRETAHAHDYVSRGRTRGRTRACHPPSAPRLRYTDLRLWIYASGLHRDLIQSRVTRRPLRRARAARRAGFDPGVTSAAHRTVNPVRTEARA
jgi:hypothetical protein